MLVRWRAEFLGCLALAVCIVAPQVVWGEDGAPGLRPIVFVSQWEPKAEFAGFYVAKEKGFYKDVGLDVTIQYGGVSRSTANLLKQGKAQFITSFLSTAIRARSTQGISLVNIAQLSQESEQILVARKSSGINKPQDLDGKKISLWPEFNVRPLALIRKYNLNVQIVPQNETLNLFLRGGVDVATAMTFDGYHLLIQAGMDEKDLTVIKFGDYGLAFPEDGIYCLDSTIAHDKEMCRSFVAATLKGWRYAFEHNNEAVEITIRYARKEHMGTSIAHQQWILNQMRDIIFPPKKGAQIGHLDHDDYENAVTAMKEVNIIQSAPTYDEFYISCVE